MTKTRDKVYDAAENVKPYVERAMSDEKLRDDVMSAFSTAKELYSELVGLQVRGHRRARGAERRELLSEIGAVTFGVAFPAVFFVLAAAGALDQDTAFTIAKWTGLGLIALYGFVGARVAGASVLIALLQASTVALIGGALIALKALVH